MSLNSFTNISSYAPTRPEGTISNVAKAYEKLDDDLMDEYAEELGISESNEPHTIGSFNEAEYYLKRYHKAQKENEAYNEAANKAIKDYIDKVNKWLESVSAPNNNDMEYCKGLLQEYAMRQSQKSGKRTIKLIEGTMSFRKRQPKFEYDDDKLREYLIANNGNAFLKPQPPKIDHAMLKKSGKIGADDVFTIDGHEVPGVSVTRQDDSFDIK